MMLFEAAAAAAAKWCGAVVSRVTDDTRAGGQAEIAILSPQSPATIFHTPRSIDFRQ